MFVNILWSVKQFRNSLCRSLNQPFWVVAVVMQVIVTWFSQNLPSQYTVVSRSDRPTPVSHFRERPPRCPRSTDAALCGWCQNGDSEDPEHEPSQFPYCRMVMKWSKKWDLPISPTKCIYLTNGARRSPVIAHITRWVWHHHPCIQISQGSRCSDR